MTSGILCNVYPVNVNKIVHFVHLCICHSVLFKTVFQICMDGYCMAGPLVLSEWLYKVWTKHMDRKTAAQPSVDTVRPTALRMTVTLKAIIDALYHQIFHFCIYKRFLKTFSAPTRISCYIKTSTNKRGKWRNLEWASLEFSLCCNLFWAQTVSAVIHKNL